MITTMSKKSVTEEVQDSTVKFEIYWCSQVPDVIPEFVDQHISVNPDQTFLIEVFPEHPTFVCCSNAGISVESYLRSIGFITIAFLAKGEKNFSMGSMLIDSFIAPVPTPGCYEHN